MPFSRRTSATIKLDHHPLLISMARARKRV
jgi:hypothetical protein